MIQKIVIAVSLFLIILVALTFGESVAQQLFAWLRHVTGIVIYSFSDVLAVTMAYIKQNHTKVIIAILITIPVTLWVLRNQGDKLKKPNTNRKIAIVLALFLGWLGAHRFYLGQLGWGLIYLVLFYWMPPLAVIGGFIDAIRYLFKSDENFR